jgi:hypothetical protein
VAKVQLRDCNNGNPVPPSAPLGANNSVNVPFRRNAPGVINLAELRKRQADKAPNSGGTLEPNEYALQMLRFPFRQVFGDPKDLEGKKFYGLDQFKVTLPLSEWKNTLTAKVNS